MSDEKRYDIAKKYVDKQLRKIKKNGLTIKKISPHEYKSMVKQVAQAIKA